MFTYAGEFHCLWNLEYICRKKALIRLNVDYGQGYFLGKPEKETQKIISMNVLAEDTAILCTANIL